MAMDLVSWLHHNNLTNPHAVPDELKQEFNALFCGVRIIWPQPGGQEAFSKCDCDLVIYGGEAGGGKSFILTLEPCKWISRSNFNGIIVRKTFSQIFDANGLWWEAEQLYSAFGGKPKQSKNPHYVFDSGAKIFFKHSQHAKHVEANFQGLAGAYIGIDELTQFEKEEFFYIIGRNRNTAGIDSYVRCTCNPDPDSWVKDVIRWWIDDEGDVIDERCGVVRYWILEDDEFITAGAPEEILDKFPNRERSSIKTMTFIRGRLGENKMMDEGYSSNLENQTAAKKKALRDGNWNHFEHKGAMFSHKNFAQYRVDSAPDSMRKIIIGVDPAGSTSDSADDTGIVGAGTGSNREIYVLDDFTGKYHPNEWAEKCVDMYDSLDADYVVAEANYGGDMVKNTIEMYCKSIGRSDVKVKLVNASRGKIVRAQPIATLYENGKVHHVGHTKLKKLESEMVSSFVEGKKPAKSPNRGDALVWAITELAIKKKKHMPRIGMVG